MSNYNVNLYFIIKEAYYFKDKKLLYDTLENVASSYLAKKDERLFLFQPDEKEMKNLFFTPHFIKEEKKQIIIISTLPCPKAYESFFVIKPLPNLYGLLNSTQKAEGLSEEEALERELGLSVIHSPFTLKDIGGAWALKTYTAQLIKAEKKDYRAKGIFLVGIPGTGKTFFPKCFAGELKRKLIALNLSQIMESDEPITKLNAIFI